jgi:hypothetical protein|tara:strand:+ start:14258 stop:15040 length:783 start_codon:yes stop_codon:yes gene_type:complete
MSKTNKVMTDQVVRLSPSFSEADFSVTKMTMDYTRFSFLDENRKVRKPFVRQLKRSLLKKDLGEKYPILVDSKYRIYDGQNRFVARMELSLPIFYQVDDSLHVNDIGMISQNVKKWAPNDWLRYHLARDENDSYKIYAGFKRRFKLSHTMALTMLNSGFYTRVMFDEFKDGTMSITNINEANELAKLSGDIRALVPFTLNKSWMIAILSILTHPEYDHKRMCKRLTKNSSKLRPCSKWQECVRELEGVYNFHSKTFVRFI